MEIPDNDKERRLSVEEMKKKFEQHMTPPSNAFGRRPSVSEIKETFERHRRSSIHESRPSTSEPLTYAYKRKLSQPNVAEVPAGFLKAERWLDFDREQWLKPYKYEDGKNIFHGNVKNTLGSRGMDWVNRVICYLRNSSAKDDNVEMFEFSSEAKLWMTKRISHHQHINHWQRWEKNQTTYVRKELDKQERSNKDYRIRVASFDETKSENIKTREKRSQTSFVPSSFSHKVKNNTVPYIPPTLRSSGEQNVDAMEMRTVLDEPMFRSSFKTFLEENYCEENLIFLEETIKFKELVESSDLINEARRILKEFISLGAEKQVNIDAPTRKFIEADLDNYISGKLDVKIENIFDVAYEKVYEMLERDVYKRFTDSSQYTEVISTYIEEQLMNGNMSIFKGEGWVYEPKLKSLHFILIKAGGLSLKPKSKIYCQVTVDAKVFKTEKAVYTVSEKDPKESDWIWNSEIVFPLLSTTQFVELNLLDGSDDILGTVFIPMERVVKSEDEKNNIESVKYILLSRSESNKDVSGFLELKVWMSTKDDGGEALTEKKGGSSIADFVRKKKSKKQRRFQEDGFDLDLTYISDRVIAMGFPSESIQRIYRNRMKDVQRFFQKRHPSSFKVYNLCNEPDFSYDPEKFEGRVGHYGFDDHNPPNFQLIPEFVEDVYKWLNEYPQNVVAIHCKAGKGRSGLMVCSYFLYIQHPSCLDGQSALDFYANQRTEDCRGVTVPSQRRYVQYADIYFKKMRQVVKTLQLSNPFPPISYVLPPTIHFIKKISLFNYPKEMKPFNVNVWFVLSQRLSSYTSKSKILARRDEVKNKIEWGCGNQVPIAEDVKLEIFYGTMFGKEKVLQLWMNSRFLDKKRYRFLKTELDKPHKDVNHEVYPENMYLEIEFDKTDHRVDPNIEEKNTNFGKKIKASDKQKGLFSHLIQRSTRNSQILLDVNDNMKLPSEKYCPKCTFACNDTFCESCGCRMESRKNIPVSPGAPDYRRNRKHENPFEETNNSKLSFESKKKQLMKLFGSRPMLPK